MNRLAHPLALWESVFQTVLIAVRALRRNRLRSGLTALGIIIGVAAVVAMVAVGNGAQDSITRQVSALGENLLTISPGNRRSGGVSSGQGSASSLTVGDAAAIAREVSDVVAVSPDLPATAQVIARGRNWSTSVVGVSAEYLRIRDWKLSSGSMFTRSEERRAARVAILGSSTALELFGPVSPLGETVRVGKIPFLVIGVLESKGAGMGGQNQDDRLLIPYTTAMRRITGDRYLRSVQVQVRTADRMESTEAQISRLLRQRHRLAASEADDFSLFNQKEVADTVNAVTGVVKLLLGAISGLSLVVGGIGIMNIMLVSVTERTREIGIRIAVGARPAEIRRQFLVEAVTLSLLGGAVGVLLGIATATLVGRGSSLQPVVTADSVVLAFCVSAAVGVFFGYYPARRAAALDPIEALRYE